MVLCAEVGKVECLCAEEVSFLKSLINLFANHMGLSTRSELHNIIIMYPTSYCYRTITLSLFTPHL